MSKANEEFTVEKKKLVQNANDLRNENNFLFLSIPEEERSNNDFISERIKFFNDNKENLEEGVQKKIVGVIELFGYNEETGKCNKDRVEVYRIAIDAGLGHGTAKKYVNDFIEAPNKEEFIKCLDMLPKSQTYIKGFIKAPNKEEYTIDVIKSIKSIEDKFTVGEKKLMLNGMGDPNTDNLTFLGVPQHERKVIDSISARLTYYTINPLTMDHQKVTDLKELFGYNKDTKKCNSDRVEVYRIAIDSGFGHETAKNLVLDLVNANNKEKYIECLNMLPKSRTDTKAYIKGFIQATNKEEYTTGLIKSVKLIEDNFTDEEEKKLIYNAEQRLRSDYFMFLKIPQDESTKSESIFKRIKFFSDNAINLPQVIQDKMPAVKEAFGYNEITQTCDENKLKIYKMAIDIEALGHSVGRALITDFNKTPNKENYIKYLDMLPKTREYVLNFINASNKEEFIRDLKNPILITQAIHNKEMPVRTFLGFGNKEPTIDEMKESIKLYDGFLKEPNQLQIRNILHRFKNMDYMAVTTTLGSFETKLNEAKENLKVRLLDDQKLQTRFLTYPELAEEWNNIIINTNIIEQSEEALKQVYDAAVTLEQSAGKSEAQSVLKAKKVAEYFLELTPEYQEVYLTALKEGLGTQDIKYEIEEDFGYKEDWQRKPYLKFLTEHLNNNSNIENRWNDATKYANIKLTELTESKIKELGWNDISTSELLKKDYFTFLGLDKKATEGQIDSKISEFEFLVYKMHDHPNKESLGKKIKEAKKTLLLDDVDVYREDLKKIEELGWNDISKTELLKKDYFTFLDLAKNATEDQINPKVREIEDLISRMPDHSNKESLEKKIKEAKKILLSDDVNVYKDALEKLKFHEVARQAFIVAHPELNIIKPIVPESKSFPTRLVRVDKGSVNEMAQEIEKRVDAAREAAAKVKTLAPSTAAPLKPTPPSTPKTIGKERGIGAGPS